MRNGMAGMILTLMATIAHADDYLNLTGDLSPTNERVRLSLGVTKVASATDIRLDSSTHLPGTALSAENDLGLSRSNFEPKFQVVVRAAERHRLRFDYFTLDRTGDKTLSGAPLVFRDVILLAGDPVNTSVSVRMLGLTYGYSFWHSEKLEIAGTLGVNITDISTRARVQTQTRHIDQQEDQAGPLPTVGFDATWVLSKRFYLDGRAQYLKVTAQQLNGSLAVYEIDALYRLRPNISFALGYNSLQAKLSSTSLKQSGYLNFKAKGPEFFVRVAF